MSIPVAALAAALLVPALGAQDALRLPQLSPPCELAQTVGMTRIEVSYGAPSVRGRTIFGDKVPFDALWRAGANANTVLAFSTDVVIEGQPLAAGRYGLHAIPGESSWELILSHDSEAWGSYAYDPDRDALRVTVRPTEAPFREQLRFAFEDVTDDAATLQLHWERTAVPLRIATDLAGLVLAPAREAAAADSDEPGWQFWFQAADFGRAHGVDGEELLDWLDRSLAVQRSFTNLWARSEVLADLGRGDEARTARDQALELVNLDELRNLAYRYVQRGDHANAVRIFEMVVAQDDSWWPWSMLGQSRLALGDRSGAAEAFRQALRDDPDRATRSELEAHLAALQEG